MTSSATLRIECVLQCENHLGEGPIWDFESGCLYWVDGTGRRVGNPSIWRLDPRTGSTRHWSLDADVGALALRKDGGAVLALGDGFYFFDLDRNRLEQFLAGSLFRVTGLGVRGVPEPRFAG